MKHKFTLILFVMLAVLTASYNATAQATYYGPMYLHECSASNTYGHITDLNTAVVGSNGSDKLLFTHRYGTPAFTHNAYLTNATGIYFWGQWSIFDETFADLSTNIAFNVINVKQNGTAFTHTVTLDNIPWDLPNCSLLDHPLLNNNPGAIILVSKTWDNGVYNTKHVGAYYDPVYNKWCVYDEDNSGTLPINSTFNIFVPNASSTCFKHTSTEGNYITVLNHPLLNGNPEANVFITHDWGSSGPYTNHESGVWYNGSNWTIYAEDFTPFPNGTLFNVVVASSTPYVDAVKPHSNVISVFPNPASDLIKINGLTENDVEFTILNTEGKLVLNGNINSKNNRVSVVGLPAGIYIIKFPGTAITAQKINVVR